MCLVYYNVSPVYLFFRAVDEPSLTDAVDEPFLADAVDEPFLTDAVDEPHSENVIDDETDVASTILNEMGFDICLRRTARTWPFDTSLP